MINLFLVLFISTSYAAPAAKTPSCGAKVKAFTEYEDVEKGQVVPKFSVYEVPDWSPDSAFDGLVVKKTEASGALLRMTLQPKKKNEKPTIQNLELESWSRDASYLWAKNLKTHDTFEGFFGTFKVGLIKNSKTLCEDQYDILTEDSDDE